MIGASVITMLICVLFYMIGDDYKRMEFWSMSALFGMLSVCYAGMA